MQESKEEEVMSMLNFWNMTKPELIQYLYECGADPEANNFECMNKRELIAYILRCYRPRKLEICFAD